MRVSTTRPPSGRPGRRRARAVGPPPQDGDAGEKHGLVDRRCRDERGDGCRGREGYPDPAGQKYREDGKRRDHPLPDRWSRFRTEQACDGFLPRVTVGQRAEAHVALGGPHTLNSSAPAGQLRGPGTDSSGGGLCHRGNSYGDSSRREPPLDPQPVVFSFDFSARSFIS